MLGKRSCKICLASGEVCKQFSEKRLWPFSMWFCLAVIFIRTSLGTSKSCNILQLLNRRLLLLALVFEEARRKKRPKEFDSKLKATLIYISLCLRLLFRSLPTSGSSSHVCSFLHSLVPYRIQIEMTMLPYLGSPSLKYEVDIVTSADDKVLCQIVKHLWGKACRSSAYDLNLLVYFLALHTGTRCLPVISLWVYHGLPTILPKMKVVALVYLYWI